MRALRDVNLKQGLSAIQAQAVASLYLAVHISNCGAVDIPKLRRGKWTVTPLVGIAAVPDEHPIIVDAATGGISRRGGPSYSSLTDFLRLLSPNPSLKPTRVDKPLLAGQLPR